MAFSKHELGDQDTQLTEATLAEARRLGFDLAGVAPHEPPAHAAALGEWLDAGHAGELAYMARSAAGRMDPRVVLPQGRSILVVGKHYRAAEPLDAIWRDPARGRISRYAWGLDYHDVL